MRKALFCSVLVLSLSVACRRGEDSPTPPATSAAAPSSSAHQETEAITPQRVQDAVTALEALAAVHRAAPDCDALAEQIGELEKQKKLPDVAPAVMRAIEKDGALAERLHHAMEGVMTASMKCRGNAAFDALQTRLRAAKAP